MTDKKHENNELDLDKTLVETTHKVEHFYEDNKKNINIAIIALVVLVGGYIGYKKLYLEPREKRFLWLKNTLKSTRLIWH